MKVRKSFVSNSSSSSFILTSKLKNPKFVLEVPLEDIASVIITNRTQLDDWFRNRHSYRGTSTVEEILIEEPELKNQYNAMLRALLNLETLYCGRLDSEYEGWNQYFYDNAFPKTEGIREL